MGARAYIGGFLLVASGALAIACSSASSDSSLNGSPSSGSSSGAISGETAVQTRGCPKCHGADMSGSVAPLGNQPSGVNLYPPNLTPDQGTGIGSWDDLQLQEAIVEGVDKEGLNLCPEMKHYKTMADDEVAAIIAYLRSLPPVKKVIPGSICPPLKGG